MSRASEGGAAVARHEVAASKEHLDLAEVVALSVELARRVRGGGHAPEIVVGLATGGLLPARVVADELDLPLAVLTIRRGGSVLKARLARVPGLARLGAACVATPVLRWPFVAAIRLADRAFRQERASRREWPERVLLVDDAQQTGATVTRAEELLVAGGARAITRAVLTWSPAPSAASHPPDVFIGRRLQHYPWSANSPHRAEWIAWLRERQVEGAP